MATVIERSQALAALAPLVQAAAAGTAQGGGGRQHVAAAVAAVIRTSAAVLFGVQEAASDICAEVAAREQLARPFLAEQVAAGRAGAQPRPCGGAKAYRDWAQHAEFGVGAAEMPSTAREARQRGRGQRRRDKAAAGASSPPFSPGATGAEEESAASTPSTASSVIGAVVEPIALVPPFPTLREPPSVSAEGVRTAEHAALGSVAISAPPSAATDAEAQEQATSEEKSGPEAEVGSDEFEDSEERQELGGPFLHASTLGVVGQPMQAPSFAVWLREKQHREAKGQSPVAEKGESACAEVALAAVQEEAHSCEKEAESAMETPDFGVWFRDRRSQQEMQAFLAEQG